MKRKSKVFIYRRGYWFALGSCALISILNGLKYAVMLKNNPVALDMKKGLFSVAVLFIISATISILIVRWYYKLKDTPPRHSQ